MVVRAKRGPRCEGSASPPSLSRKACDTTRALVVDDEPGIVRAFSALLSGALPGLGIDEAGNGEQAVQIFRERHHAVLVMDLNMPVMDGRSAFREIDRFCRARNWDVPSFVFCTGFAPPDSLRDIIGADSKHALLLKPVSEESIVSAVTNRIALQTSHS